MSTASAASGVSAWTRPCSTAGAGGGPRPGAPRSSMSAGANSSTSSLAAALGPTAWLAQQSQDWLVRSNTAFEGPYVQQRPPSGMSVRSRTYAGPGQCDPLDVLTSDVGTAKSSGRSTTSTTTPSLSLSSIGSPSICKCSTVRSWASAAAAMTRSVGLVALPRCRPASANRSATVSALHHDGRDLRPRECPTAGRKPGDVSLFVRSTAARGRRYGTSRSCPRAAAPRVGHQPLRSRL